MLKELGSAAAVGMGAAMILVVLASYPLDYRIPGFMQVILVVLGVGVAFTPRLVQLLNDRKITLPLGIEIQDQHPQPPEEE